jgi:hypothetical protein
MFVVPLGPRPPSRRYRYDQIMRLGWKVFIPITLVWIAVVGLHDDGAVREQLVLDLVRRSSQ